MSSIFTQDPSRPGERRSSTFPWLPNRARYLFIACWGEFWGTFLFLFFAFAATQVANNLLGGRDMDIPTLLYIALAFGLSLAVNVWIFFRVSGGLFNPAVTVALALIGAVGWLKAILLVIFQVLGAVASAAVVSVLFPGPLTVRTTLGPGTSVVRGLFIEAFLTFELICCIFMLAAEKHRATFLAPVGIGLALFIAELAGILFTGGSLNPARSFGPDVVLHTFDGNHWIYWIGPMLGALIAVLFYRLLKLLEYETAIPDADGDGKDAREQGPKGFNAHVSHGMTDGTTETDLNLRSLSGQSGNHATYIGEPLQKSAQLQSHPRASGSDHVGQILDGTHDQIDHADDRPRAKHTNHQAASDLSYRSGPDTESGRSTS